MTRLSNNAKTAIIMQALNRGSRRIADIAAANNIGKSTLNKWVKNYKNGIIPEKSDSSERLPKDHKSLNAEQKFQHILESNGLDEISLGKYCRQHGLYAHELTTWKSELMNNKNLGDNSTGLKAELNELKAKNKQLERELRRKDKALAEASALLILKKKSDLIWGDPEDD